LCQYQFILLSEQRHMCVSNFPRVVTWNGVSRTRTYDLLVALCHHNVTLHIYNNEPSLAIHHSNRIISLSALAYHVMSNDDHKEEIQRAQSCTDCNSSIIDISVDMWLQILSWYLLPCLSASLCSRSGKQPDPAADFRCTCSILSLKIFSFTSVLRNGLLCSLHL